MSLFDYQRSQAIARADEPFYGIIMAAMRRADSTNIIMLRHAFPEVWAELEERYNAPGGILDIDPEWDRV